MKDAQELRNELRNFTGTETWFRHPLNRNITYTEGTKFFVENAGGGAYWLLDILVTQPEILTQMREGGFATITLEVVGSKATLTCGDGNDNVVYRREIDYTDCPEGTWVLWFTDNVILLPSEY